MVKPIKKLSKTQILKIVGHGMFGLAGGALIASPFIWSSTSVQNKLPKAKLTLVETNNSATLSMKIVRYEGFLAVIKDLQVKFVNHSGKEQILSLVDNTIWNSKNISSLEEQANLQVNQGPFPNVGQDLSFVLTTNDNTKIQNINFQAQVIYHNKYKVPYTQVSNIVTYKIK